MSTSSDAIITKITTDQTAIREDLISALKLVYNAHLRGAPRLNDNLPPSMQGLKKLATTYVPSDSDTEFDISTLFPNGGIFVNVLDQEEFDNNYNTIDEDNSTDKYIDVDLSSGIYWSSDTTKEDVEYVALDDTIDITGTGTTFMTSDINAYELMTSTNNFAILAKQLRELKVAYQMLDDKVFQHLMSLPYSVLKPEVNLFPNVKSFPIYDMENSANQSQVNTVNNVPEEFISEDSLVRYVRTMDPRVQDLFVMRRLILCTYIIANFRLFFGIFLEKFGTVESQVESGSLDTTGTKTYNQSTYAAKIALYFYNKLQKINTSYEDNRNNPSSEVNNTVHEAVAKHVKLYNENTSRLSHLYDDIRDSKRLLKNEIIRIDAEKASSDYATKLRTITIVFAVIFAVSMLVVMMLPFEYSQRIKIAGVIAVLIVILAIAMSMVVKRVDPRNVEGFLVSPVVGLQDAIDGQNVDNYKNLVEMLIIEEMRNFYRYTIDTAMALKNSSLYNELNYNTGKERNYFENSQFQLNKSVTDARNAQRLYDRKTKVSTALIKFIVQILVIVAFVIIGAVAVEDTYPALRPFIFIIGAIMAMVVLMLFFGEILGRTRIDGDKMYWGTPDAVKNLG